MHSTTASAAYTRSPARSAGQRARLPTRAARAAAPWWVSSRTCRLGAIPPPSPSSRPSGPAVRIADTELPGRQWRPERYPVRARRRRPAGRGPSLRSGHADGTGRSLETFPARGEKRPCEPAQPPCRSPSTRCFREWLGVGEVRIELDSLGPTSIHETAYPGIWWVVHRNRDGEIMTQQVEVTACPEIIRSQQEDIHEGLQRLREALPTGESA
ncbi:hydrogenase expression/formation C-terminal domain-containing protein [Thiohalobacter thiocyanaticus]|uniref:HupH hydrogenase expression protein C-terminal domain-containing protein n=1 Tax=Thiohalobacter thiocyanaticus TaxID=585455 RepID=A0A426QM73_9GAMM|nr:hydrogenase expression/formation C-terminal domain-containing protein [Thiohalobacter thiocyanaticus]RRQ22861.1 hypothetical protein D6C00_13585 [Thiohalobacter thiocyanaticus]